MTPPTATTPALFDLPTTATGTPDVPDAVTYQPHPTGPVAGALAGDGYGWLAAVLPAPAPLVCDLHRTPMVLADPPPLWVCPTCTTPAGAP